MDQKTRIKGVRTRIETLDASLDDQRTPYLKSKLRSAKHDLDDAELALRHAESSPSDATRWHNWAELSIQQACQITDLVRETVRKYGGPENVLEVAGN